MNPLIKTCGALLALLSNVAFAQIPDDSRQLIVVTTPDWNAIQGTAQRYERHGQGFQKVGEPFAIVVGKNGMAWGTGLTTPAPDQQPLKREGDGKAPAGIFTLGSAFGYASTAATRLPYTTSTATRECVDDSQSSHYNTLVDSLAVNKDWTSSEQMLRKDQLYRQGIFVEHNTPASANDGSCIFLHIWRSNRAGTLGCTAMDPAQIQQLFAWLDPREHPLLVQLPVAQYEQYRGRWKLPSR
ncbi:MULTISPECIES: L,D-transpeptidase [unclassified Pseudomonas]|uniref:L,D-transpeptidase family protein n=1 Tax=unclassified Pseudomonas TaxID=196821 RepID=UPI0015A46891|nr:MULTISPECIES: L,D-transpeptidase family protein [unclassified Pseudomonas]NWC96750.1 L,D-transpeptidase family protein [Pseudomonas sp. IPO3779]NWD21559.1 L,D-transpeptidase family protein [Pseudomonas sp. IPO3778]